MRLSRYHGLGNDYLVLETGGPLDPERVVAICDRHRGVGGDGILEPFASARADRGVRIWNPDGSVAEKSGNGLRIFARWAHDRDDAPAALTVDTGHEVVACAVGEQVEVAMGLARFETPLRCRLALSVGEVEGVVVDLGNPHFVVFDGEGLPWPEVGRALEVHPRFANRTNVQLARVEGPTALSARIWERGAGETLASGSSACAVAAAAVETGRVAAGVLSVHMEGGSLQVTVGTDRRLRMVGPVERIGTMEVDPGWLARRPQKM